MCQRGEVHGSTCAWLARLAAANRRMHAGMVLFSLLERGRPGTAGNPACNDLLPLLASCSPANKTNHHHPTDSSRRLPFGLLPSGVAGAAPRRGRRPLQEAGGHPAHRCALHRHDPQVRLRRTCEAARGRLALQAGQGGRLPLRTAGSRLHVRHPNLGSAAFRPAHCVPIGGFPLVCRAAAAPASLPRCARSCSGWA